MSKQTLKNADLDTTLMMAFKEGDEMAFNELMKRNYREVLNFAFRFTCNRALSEELAQDIFLKLYKAGKSYRGEAKFKTFLFRIAVNHCLNELRRVERKFTHKSIYDEYEDGRGYNPRDIPDTKSETPETIMQRKESDEIIMKCLNSLPQRQRFIFILVRYHGMDLNEAAESIDTSVSGVKALLHRATITLREKLLPYLKEV